MVKTCFGRRPDGKLCTNAVPPGNKAFCNRCDQEIFNMKPRFKFELQEREKPNHYEPEPVEIPFLDKEEPELGISVV